MKWRIVAVLTSGVAAALLPTVAGYFAPKAKRAAPATSIMPRHEGSIAYDDTGSGALVVLVPGIGDLRQQYRFLAPHLAAAGYRVVAMDLRGLGESSTGWSDYSAAAIGDDVVALLRELDAGPAFLIGQSMGAGAAAWAAAEAPDHVRGLVLIGPFVRDVPPVSRFQAALIGAMINVGLLRPWGPPAWSAYYASLYPTAKPADLAAYRAALKANVAEQGRLEAVRAMMNTSKAGVEARLGQVRAPTLVVMGTKDPDFAGLVGGPEGEASVVAERLRGRVLMVPGAGHYPHVEMPDEVNPAIIQFLDEHRPR